MKYRQIRKTAKEEVKWSRNLGSVISMLNIRQVGYEKECGYFIKYNNDKNVVITFSGKDAYLESESLLK